MDVLVRTVSTCRALVFGALAIVLAAPASTIAQTPCREWNVSEGWHALQGDYSVKFELVQNKTRLSGTGSYEDRTFTPFLGRRLPPGPYSVDGSIRGNKIEIITGWGGVYTGTIDKTGRIDGITYDKNNSSSSAAWHSDRRMNCRVTADTAAAATPKPTTPESVARDASGRSGGGAASAIRGSIPAAPSAANPLPASAVTPPRVGKTCQSAYVYRLASAGDKVCVTAKSQARVAEENRNAAKRRQPGGGTYGPNTCRAGYVWREAFPGDLVCVTPAARALAANENGLAASRARER